MAEEQKIHWVESLLYKWGRWATMPDTGFPKQVAWSRMAPPNKVFGSRDLYDSTPQDVHDIDTAIRSQSPEDITLLVCVYGWGLSLRATARRTGGTYNAVRGRVYALHGKLAGLMDARR